MHRTASITCIPGRQQGAALFMALIFLLIMTILGVFGMNISRMENMMAGNNQFQTTALNNAELTLAIAEQEVGTFLGTSTPFNAHYYDRTGMNPDATVINPSALNWEGQFAYATYDPGDGSDANKFRYVIEYAGPEVVPGNATDSCAEDPDGDACVHTFLVTTQAETSRGAKRTVQSVFVTSTTP